MTTKNGISAYYYPTLAVLVDDNERFLNTISLQLDTNLPYLTFPDSSKALKFIEQKKSGSLAEKCLLDNAESDGFGLNTSQQDIKVNLSKLYHHVYSKDRFNEIAVVVVDYSMPNMNGPEFCKKIRAFNKFIQIILLTGEADEGKGIEMFNDKIIDTFILKNSPTFGEQVNNAISKSQKLYFESQSEGLIGTLSSRTPSCFKDPAFIKLFHEIITKHKIVEYYLVENTGSFLLLKNNGSLSWLIVQSEAELKEYYDIAEDYLAGAGILNFLKSGQKIPFFRTRDEYMKKTGVNWEENLYTAQKINGKETNYYYALVENRNLLDVEKDSVLSFKDYMLYNWPPR